MIIDTHSHIYSPEFDEDRDEVIARAEAVGVRHHLLANVDVSTIRPLILCHERYPAATSMAMGLHPTAVGEDFESQLREIENALAENSFAAIGEIGIDLYWDKTFYRQQRDALAVQLRWAASLGLPVILHVRKAYAETFAIIKELRLPNLRGVMHCFSGGIEEAKKAVDLGFYLGIGGVVTYKNSGLPEIIEKVGLGSILLETDAPYLSPVPNRGRRNEPGNLPYVSAKIASILQEKCENVEKQTSENAKELFKIA